MRFSCTKCDMTSQRALLAQQWPRLVVAASIRPLALRNRVLKQFSRDDAFCSLVRVITKNILRKRVPVGKRDCCKLRKYRKTLHAINRQHNCRTTKRRLTGQVGGFAPLLVAL